MDFKTVSELRRATNESGSYFFSPDTMRWFGTKMVDRKVYGGRVFITSEESPDGTLFMIRVAQRTDSGIMMQGVYDDPYSSPRDLATAQKIAKWVAARELPERFTYEQGKELDAAVRAEFA